MTSLIPLDIKKHKNHKVKKAHNFSFANKDNLCPIILAELNHLIPQTPIIFAKNENAGYELCSLQGLDTGQNCFVSKEGQWKANYIPSKYRSYPFTMALEQNSQKKILCFHSETTLIVDDKNTQGAKLFNDDSSPSDFTQKMLAFLNAVSQNQIATKTAVATIVENGLLEDWSIKIKGGSAEKVLTGIQRINMEKFKSLDDQLLVVLKNAGSLDLIYASYFSLQSIEKLGKLLAESGKEHYTSHKDRAMAQKTFAEKKEVDNLVHNLLLDD